MAMRQTPFENGEHYHVFNRGVNKGKIFFSGGDWAHFQRLLFMCNSTEPITKASRVQGVALDTIERGEPFVAISAYALMPNHFHILLQQKTDGGIRRYMHKLQTAFSMYINTKYDRSGSLMCRPFKARYVDSDEYYRWLFTYIHSNPIELHTPDWRNPKNAIDELEEFALNYSYSSYRDYFGFKDRMESLILDKESLLVDNLSELKDLNMSKATPWTYVEGSE